MFFVLLLVFFVVLLDGFAVLLDSLVMLFDSFAISLHLFARRVVAVVVTRLVMTMVMMTIVESPVAVVISIGSIDRVEQRCADTDAHAARIGRDYYSGTRI